MGYITSKNQNGGNRHYKKMRSAVEAIFFMNCNTHKFLIIFKP